MKRTTKIAIFSFVILMLTSLLYYANAGDAILPDTDQPQYYNCEDGSSYVNSKNASFATCMQPEREDGATRANMNGSSDQDELEDALMGQDYAGDVDLPFSTLGTLSSTSSEFPMDFISQKWDEGYTISSITYKDEWAVVMSKGTGYSSQTWHIRSDFPSKVISEKWDEGYMISSITYGNDPTYGDVWAVVMSKGTGYSSQTWHTRSDFPSKVISEKWDEGYMISNITYGGAFSPMQSDGVWAVVMSKGTDYTAQTWATTSDFPSKVISEKWDEGYMISSISSNDSTVGGGGIMVGAVWAVVMSKGTGYAGQYWAYNTEYPTDWIYEKWNQGIYISDITYGKGIWAVVMSEKTGYSGQTCNVGSETTIPKAPVLDLTTTGTTVTVSWTTVENATGYYLYYTAYPDGGYVGQISVGTKTSLSYTLWYGASFTVWVKAFNSEGSSEASNRESFVISASSTPPNTSIKSGPSGTITYNDVTFTYTGSDDETSTSDLVYSYYLEGYSSSWSSYSASTSKTFKNLGNGSYTFKVRAKDQAGNVDSTPASISFKVNTGGGPPAGEYTISAFLKEVTYATIEEHNITISLSSDNKWTATDEYKFVTNGQVSDKGKWHYSGTYNKLIDSSVCFWDVPTGTDPDVGSWEIGKSAFLACFKDGSVSDATWNQGVTGYWKHNGECNAVQGGLENISEHNKQTAECNWSYE